MRALQRPAYMAAYTVAYVAVGLALGFLVLMGWWFFALVVLQEFGCDGFTGPCGSVGRFTSDYWWLINVTAAVLIALALLPMYRRLLRDTRGVDALEIGGISDASRQPKPPPQVG
jgi:H+/Cl- antiporter ClcA